MTDRADAIIEWIMGLPLDADGHAVLAAARAESRRLGRGPLWTPELLIGVASVRGIASHALGRFGLTRDVLEQWAMDTMGHATRPPPEGAEEHFTARGLAVMSLAAAEARAAGSACVRPRDILMGIVREPGVPRSATGARLAEAGITFERTFANEGGGTGREPSNLRVALDGLDGGSGDG